MTTTAALTVTCRACGTTSEHERLVSADSFGWPDLDLRPPEMRRSTMRLWLQECPSCGFVAADLSKASDAEISAIAGPIWAEAVTGRDGPDALARRFARRALIERKLNRNGLAGFRMLCAAWDADDRRDTTGSNAYRTQAAVDLDVALSNEPDAKEATDWTLQLVDILRRLGRFDEAEACADRLIGNASPKVDAIGRFQLRMIMDSDSAHYSMGAAMEDDEDG